MTTTQDYTRGLTFQICICFMRIQIQPENPNSDPDSMKTWMRIPDQGSSFRIPALISYLIFLKILPPRLDVRKNGEEDDRILVKRMDDYRTGYLTGRGTEQIYIQENNGLASFFSFPKCCCCRRFRIAKNGIHQLLNQFTSFPRSFSFCITKFDDAYGTVYSSKSVRDRKWMTTF
jgi:hypothetical protein